MSRPIPAPKFSKGPDVLTFHQDMMVRGKLLKAGEPLPPDTYLEGEIVPASPHQGEPPTAS